MPDEKLQVIMTRFFADDTIRRLVDEWVALGVQEELALRQMTDQEIDQGLERAPIGWHQKQQIEKQIRQEGDHIAADAGFSAEELTRALTIELFHIITARIDQALAAHDQQNPDDPPI